MAKEEKKTNEAPALIDYEADTDTTPDTWNSNHLEKYWQKELARNRKAATSPFTIIDKKKAKDMIRDFGQDMVIEMIDHWAQKTPDIQMAVSFGAFHAARYTVYKETAAKDYSEWEA